MEETSNLLKNDQIRLKKSAGLFTTATSPIFARQPEETSTENTKQVAHTEVAAAPNSTASRVATEKTSAPKKASVPASVAVPAEPISEKSKALYGQVYGSSIAQPADGAAKPVKPIKDGNSKPVSSPGKQVNPQSANSETKDEAKDAEKTQSVAHEPISSPRTRQRKAQPSTSGSFFTKERMIAGAITLIVAIVGVLAGVITSNSMKLMYAVDTSFDIAVRPQAEARYPQPLSAVRVEKNTAATVANYISNPQFTTTLERQSGVSGGLDVQGTRINKDSHVYFRVLTDNEANLNAVANSMDAALQTVSQQVPGLVNPDMQIVAVTASPEAGNQRPEVKEWPVAFGISGLMLGAVLAAVWRRWWLLRNVQEQKNSQGSLS